MYKIQYRRSVEKQLRKLSPSVRKQVFKRINILATNPRPDGVTKLQGGDSAYRIRLGDYRIIYQIIDDKLIVEVIRIGHRSDVYRTK